MLAETLEVVCVVVLVVVLAALHAARDSTLKGFRFRISASLAKICSFSIEVESENHGQESGGGHPARLPGCMAGPSLRHRWPVRPRPSAGTGMATGPGRLTTPLKEDGSRGTLAGIRQDDREARYGRESLQNDGGHPAGRRGDTGSAAHGAHSAAWRHGGIGRCPANGGCESARALRGMLDRFRETLAREIATGEAA